ncbi:hypothetical protein [Clostridium sp. AN503]|uniref:hypothetical protein n=1 Tax=Clostridium sp. AN503 TaxID=3160598 RepID=UPI00345B04FC
MKSIMEPTPAEECFLCGRCGQLEEHHIFGGNPNRKLSEKYGLKVHLCCRCHRDNREGVHGNREKMDHLHWTGQQAFERTHSRDDFIRIFGKNYLDEEKVGNMPEQESAKRKQDANLNGIIWLK